MDYQKVLIGGRLTRDPEIRYTPKGTAVGDLAIATNRKFKKDDEWKDETTFLDVTVWGRTAENCGKYLDKGSPVFVEGRLELDEWTDRETGKKRQKLKVVADNVQFLGSKGDGERRSDRAPAGEYKPAPVDDEEEIPF